MRCLLACALFTVPALLVCTTSTNGPANAIVAAAAAHVHLVLFLAAGVLMRVLVRSS
jgi:hypothetical protein